ncbi:MAG: 50S ribosomal protein L21 [Calditrichaeota bacterium]|nr:50S ribosomal protein L21 [Calditrichota bacterium]MCB0268362.1 50S ribosomal protein L21 [Calditrichota bacterium]MCB0285673.1 50S ribosomal protein L21 [Calditrichota bacterium]MCB0300215.1 50S ribosomal protein L21 [Calditrichota bacterium]MCB9066716.1 50S ribosomal protein L21 [Calditrichia bacterium]
MYAIVEIAGKQFRVEKDKVVKVPFLSSEVGESVSFDKVLFVNQSNDVKVGRPLIDGAKVDAKVLEHGRDKKVVVFKKKRRKGYQKKNGHRQHFTKIKIEAIEG